MNKVMLIGNVGNDPEIRYYDADQAVAQFRLATSERSYTLQNGTRVPEHTDWHNIVLWKGLAKIAERYIHKGDKLYIEGRIRYRVYDDQKGVRRYVTEIYGENMEILSSRSSAVTSEQSASHDGGERQTSGNDDEPFNSIDSFGYITDSRVFI